jgi:hypothetical protein
MGVIAVSDNKKDPPGVFDRAVTGCRASGQTQAPAPLVRQVHQVRGEEVIASQVSLASGGAQELEHEKLAVILDRRDPPVEVLARMKLTVRPYRQPHEIPEPPGFGREEGGGP